MKKVYPIVVIFLSLFTFVSAYDIGSGLNYGMRQLISIVEGFFSPLTYLFFGGSGDMMFESILFLLIIVSIVYVVISKLEPFKDRKAIIWIITISVSLLTTRFMTEEMLRTMILPYSLLGIALTSVLPLMIFFILVKDFESAILRKIFWIFFIITFLGIWNSRYNELGPLSWIYFMTGVVALFLLLFDGTIRRHMVKQSMRDLDIGNREDYAARIREKIREVNEDKTEGFITEVRYKKKIKQLNKQLDRILKD
ncbi:MAG: hypothetical protein IH845_04485 [Nanoarchaeota archaeon]|nr:hypothetical protein [Nanoarchaeota archaeon]